jgi:hypothetical protein
MTLGDMSISGRLKGLLIRRFAKLMVLVDGLGENKKKQPMQPSLTRKQ